MTREELFERAFGVPAPKAISQRLWVMAVVNGNFCCKIEMDWNGDPRGGSFDPAPVLRIFESLLKPDVMKALTEPAPEGFMDVSRLHALGIGTELDQASFRLLIKIPARLLKTNTQSLKGRKVDPFLVQAHEPASFSAFLNWSAQEQYDDPSTGGGSASGRLGVGLDGALRFDDIVLEGAGLYKENGHDEWSRRDFRLVKDIAPKALRFSAGDLKYRVSGYQSVMSLGGIGVSRDYSLKPHETTYPTGDFSFYLENPSYVEIWINGALRQTLNLEAGNQDLRDFPAASGENDVEIRIRDASGRWETLNFSFIQDSTLLSKGRDRFSFNAGFMRRSDGNDYEYDGGDPGLSLFYQRGVTDTLTAGGFLQARPHHAVAGGEAAMAFGYGTFQVQAAASTLEEAGEDWTGRLSFTSNGKSAGPVRNFRWRAYVEYAGENFTLITQDESSNKQSLKTAAAAGFSLPNNFGVTLGLGWSSLHNSENVETWYANMGLTWQYGAYIFSNFSARYGVDSEGRAGSEAYLGISLCWPEKGQTVTASKYWDGGVRTRWDFRTGGAQNPGRADGYVSWGRDDYADSLEASATYLSNLGRVSATREISDYRESGRDTRYRTLLALQSSLVFADGNFGVSRPVKDSFLIAKGVGNCEDRKILINPAEDGSEAESLLFFPAVLTDFYSYRLKMVKCLPENPPITYVPKEPQTTIFPAYKSGTVVYVGTTARVQVLGRLTDASGNPLKELAVEILFPGVKEGDSELTFTDSYGRFLVLAPAAGQCLVRPLSAESHYGQASFSVPDEPDKMFRAGDIVLPPKNGGGKH